MNTEQMSRMREGKGFIAALDQSGGSTPKALELYGVPRNAYADEAGMYDAVHAMRSRIMTSPSFDGGRILGVILFEDTMTRTVDGEATADYLWKKKHIVPFLKVDRGLAEREGGVQLMKPIPDLTKLLDKALEYGIFGTKMRSVIHAADATGIRRVVEQQFEFAQTILRVGLTPIIEPEVDITIPDKERAEELLKDELLRMVRTLEPDSGVIFKLSLPCRNDFYWDLMNDPEVVRIVALSGGYTRRNASARLAVNHGVIASFSRALTEGLRSDLSDAAFDAALAQSIDEIYRASIS